MSLADFLRGNLPSTDSDPADQDLGAVSFPVRWNTTCVTIPEDEHTIFTAVRYNDCHRIEQLLRQSIDVNITHTCSDVNCQTSSGKTALMLAVQEKNVEIVRALLTAGADVTLTDVKKGTALEISLLSGGKREKAEIVRALLQAGSDPNTENLCKCTPLIVATSLGQLDVINLLLDSGANINHEDNRGKTAFHMSCEHTRSTQKNTSRLLISRGADVNHKDGSGKSPLDLAVQYNKIGTVVFLLQMDCLRNSDFMECDKTREMCKKYPQVNFFLEHEFRQPWSLLRLCRFMIRNSVEPDKLKDIQHIPNLPKTLLKYLTFSGVEFI